MQPTLETIEEIVERIKKTMLESRNNAPNQPGELKIIIAKVRDTLSTDHRIIFIPEEQRNFYTFTIEQAEAFALSLATYADELRKENVVQ